MIPYDPIRATFTHTDMHAKVDKGLTETFRHRQTHIHANGGLYWQTHRCAGRESLADRSIYMQCIRYKNAVKHRDIYKRKIIMTEKKTYADRPTRMNE